MPKSAADRRPTITCGRTPTDAADHNATMPAYAGSGVPLLTNVMRQLR